MGRVGGKNEISFLCVTLSSGWCGSIIMWFHNVELRTGLKNQVKSTNEWIDNARHRIFFNEFKVGILGIVIKKAAIIRWLISKTVIAILELNDKDSCEIYNMDTNTWNMTNVTLSEPKEISSPAE